MLYTKLISGEKITTGVVDGFLDFNIKDYPIYTPAHKLINGFSRRMRFHQFNYLGIITNRHLIGLASAKLGYLDKVFGYILDLYTGIEYQKEFTTPTIFKSKLFSAPETDFFKVHFHNRSSEVSVTKNLRNGTLDLNFDLENKLIVKAEFNYNLIQQQPLRVINSFGLDHLGFTEKSPLAENKHIEIIFNQQDIPTKPQDTFLIFDHSLGFFERNTKWNWLAGAGKDSSSGKFIGLNLAINNNYPMYSENAIWIGSKKHEFTNNVVFKFDQNNPGDEWNVFTINGKGKPDNQLDIFFKPGVGDKFRLHQDLNLWILQDYFSQFFGKFSGAYKDKNKRVIFENITGIAEVHEAMW